MTTPTLPKLLLTPEDAAAALSIGRTTMYALISRGLVRSVKIGRARRVPAQALTEYVGQLPADVATVGGSGIEPTPLGAQRGAEGVARPPEAPGPRRWGHSCLRPGEATAREPRSG